MACSLFTASLVKPLAKADVYRAVTSSTSREQLAWGEDSINNGQEKQGEQPLAVDSGVNLRILLPSISHQTG